MILIIHECSSDRKKVCLLADEIREILKKHYPKDKLIVSK
jgi:hypothetical protein